MSSYERKDSFYQKAKEEGYPARSAYKLMELDKKFKILKPNSKIIDLGCAPGGWFKVCAEKLKNSEKAIQLVGIDLLPLHIPTPPHAQFIQGDFLNSQTHSQITEKLKGQADWVISDMSPNLTGIKFKDLSASMELCEMAFEFAQTILKKQGGFVVKIFPGPDMGAFKKKLKGRFERVVDVEAEATRKTSNEIYLVALGFKS